MPPPKFSEKDPSFRVYYMVSNCELKHSYNINTVMCTVSSTLIKTTYFVYTIQ